MTTDREKKRVSPTEVDGLLAIADAINRLAAAAERRNARGRSGGPG